MAARMGGSRRAARAGMSKYAHSFPGVMSIPRIIEMVMPGTGFRFFPLAADMSKLQAVCDKYLNFTHEPKDERPPYYFSPATPWVVLQVNDYERLDTDNNWFVQHEVILSIAVEWRARDGDHEAFQDWALISPFLYVDNTISVWMGREVYGWPKVEVRLADLPPVMDPAEPQRLAAFDLPTFSADHPDRPMRFERFLEVCQNPRPSGWLGQRPGDIYSAVPRIISDYMWAASEMIGAFMGARGPYYRPERRDAASYRTMLERWSGYADAWWPWLWSAPGPQEALRAWAAPGPRRAASDDGIVGSPFMKNQITLKQFRDAIDTSTACYQAIVRSSTRVHRVNDAGWLIDPLTGDPTGGMYIKLYDAHAQPIVDTLGIQTVGGGKDKHGPFSIVRPVWPFWWNLDVSYGWAENLCWRGKDTHWAADGEQPLPRSGKPGHDYVPLGSGARREVPGPFEFPSVTIHVLPLPAKAANLEPLLKEYLGDIKCEPVRHEREPGHCYVLLLATQFARMKSEGPEKREWADSEAIFAVPAYMDGEGLVLFPLLGFAGAEWNAITKREVYGRLSLRSVFSADDPAMSQLEPVWGERKWKGYKDLFDVSTTLCHAYEQNQQIRPWRILRVACKVDEHDEHAAGEREDRRLQEQLKKLGFEKLAAPGGCFHSLALKRFPDADDTDKSCYAALVKMRMEFPTDREHQENPRVSAIKQKLVVGIYKFKTVPLVEKLGLKVGGRGRDNQGEYELVEVEAPFSIQGWMRETAVSNVPLTPDAAQTKS